MLRILPGDFENPQVIDLLREHLSGMHEHTPPGLVHALDLSGLQHPDISFFTAWDGEELLGMGAIKEIDDRTGEIKSMRTNSRSLRRGVGTAILKHLIRVARERHYDMIKLETGTGPAFEPAVALYKKFGFVTCGVFGDYQASHFNQFFELHLVSTRAQALDGFGI